MFTVISSLEMKFRRLFLDNEDRKVEELKFYL